MNKNVKIIIGANYGDEGKGLLTRYFAKQNKEDSIVIFHNGTAQRGHTVDYTPHFRHVYHHFGCGTGDNVPTYFADTFWVHPMSFVREYVELAKNGIYPITYCSPYAHIITPFDMLIDHVTEAWIGYQRGEREYGSCGLGSWCAIESRGEDAVFTVEDYLNLDDMGITFLLNETWKDCLKVLASRGVNVEVLPQYKDYFIPDSWRRKNLISHFIDDLRFFFSRVKICDFDIIYNNFNNLIFENAQGLGLDMNVDSDWHTTSNTGLTNPYLMLKDKEDFNAEVCYVTRSYLTRHGIGPLEEAVQKKEINENMIDRTNVHNEFQGSLRYGYLEDKEQSKRIDKDFGIVFADNRFKRSLAVTHCNEFPDLSQNAIYMSNNPYNVIQR